MSWLCQKGVYSTWWSFFEASLCCGVAPDCVSLWNVSNNSSLLSSSTKVVLVAWLLDWISVGLPVRYVQVIVSIFCRDFRHETLINLSQEKHKQPLSRVALESVQKYSWSFINLIRDFLGIAGIQSSSASYGMN